MFDANWAQVVLETMPQIFILYHFFFMLLSITFWRRCDDLMALPPETPHSLEWQRPRLDGEDGGGVLRGRLGEQEGVASLMMNQGCSCWCPSLVSIQPPGEAPLLSVLHVHNHMAVLQQLVPSVPWGLLALLKVGRLFMWRLSGPSTAVSTTTTLRSLRSLQQLKQHFCLHTG